MRKKVVIESPYGGNLEEVARNIKYVRACMRDSLERGEAPFASHALYTQPGVLDDDVPSERRWGMEAGFDIGEIFDLRVFYADLGMTSGMQEGMEKARLKGQSVEERLLGDDWEEKYNERWKRHSHKDLF